MLIQVHYHDNHFDYIKDHMLCGLIESGEIVRFKRSSGWVTVGEGPLRKLQSFIEVVYTDDCYDYITNEMLDNLLDSNKIAKFQRSTGWVRIGVDPIRKTRRGHSANC